MNLVTVAGKPKSGTTWLCTILAEICDGATPVGNYKRKATSGWRVVRMHGGPRGLDGIDHGIVVLTKRDPRDVVCSMKRTWVHKTHEHHALSVSQEWGPMLEVWRKHDPAPVETSYEAIRADGVAEVQRLAREVFGMNIGEAEAIRCLEAYVPKRPPTNVGDWQTDLDPAAVELLHTKLGDTMKAEGYAVT